MGVFILKRNSVITSTYIVSIPISKIYTTYLSHNKYLTTLNVYLFELKYTKFYFNPSQLLIKINSSKVY